MGCLVKVGGEVWVAPFQLQEAPARLMPAHSPVSVTWLPARTAQNSRSYMDEIIDLPDDHRHALPSGKRSLEAGWIIEEEDKLQVGNETRKLPRLIAIKVDRGYPINLDSLRAAATSHH
jgi:hypothetical protein